MRTDSSRDLMVSALRNGDKKAFENVYDHMSGALYGYVYKRVNNREIAEGIVQEVFMSLWSKRKGLEINTSIERYLYGMAKFQILNHMRSEKVKQKYLEGLTVFLTTHTNNPTEELLSLNDMKFIIDQCVSQLPAKCQQAFRLSRYEHLSVKEVAEHMGISTRTVENYITKSLKHLRSAIGGLALIYLVNFW